MEHTIKPNSPADYIGGIFIAGVFIAGIVIVWSFTHSSPKTPFNVLAPVECPRTYDGYTETSKSKKVVLLRDFQSHVADGKLNSVTITLQRTGLNAPIVCGYLLYRMSVANNPIEEASEDLYMAPAGGQFGGHLLPNPNIAISDSIINGNKTEILMPLNQITYDGTSRTNIQEADWAALLNVSENISFNIALNSLRSGGKIDYIEIAYKCIDQKSGEESDACNIEILDPDK